MLLPYRWPERVEEDLERRLCKILRRKAEKHGVRIRPDGFAPLCDVVRALNVRERLTLEDIERMVHNSTKRGEPRYELFEYAGMLWLRATSKHTMNCVRRALVAKPADQCFADDPPQITYNSWRRHVPRAADRTVPELSEHANVHGFREATASYPTAQPPPILPPCALQQHPPAQDNQPQAPGSLSQSSQQANAEDSRPPPQSWPVHTVNGPMQGSPPPPPGPPPRHLQHPQQQLQSPLQPEPPQPTQRLQPAPTPSPPQSQPCVPVLPDGFRLQHQQHPQDQMPLCHPQSAEPDTYRVSEMQGQSSCFCESACERRHASAQRRIAAALNGVGCGSFALLPPADRNVSAAAVSPELVTSKSQTGMGMASPSSHSLDEHLRADLELRARIYSIGAELPDVIGAVGRVDNFSGATTEAVVPCDESTATSYVEAVVVQDFGPDDDADDGASHCLAIAKGMRLSAFACDYSGWFWAIHDESARRGYVPASCVKVAATVDSF